MGSKLDELEVENTSRITQQTFILGEGKSDAAFFFRFVRERQLGGFQVGWAGGKTGFASYLNGMPPRISAELRNLIIARDTDENPSAAFADTVKQLKSARSHPYPIPSTPMTIERGESLSVSILLLPDSSQKGTLETLLAPSMHAKDPSIFACMKAYAECSGAARWEIGKYSKMQVHSMIAACCPENPGGSLTMIWADKDNPISLAHACLDPLYEYLRGFGQ